MSILPQLGIRGDTITAAGISSGGFNSMKMNLIDPATFRGVGLVISAPPVMGFEANDAAVNPVQDPIDLKLYLQNLNEKESKG